jgi:uncharacterized protein involved in exopolysaccharide biosynthesis
MEKELKEIIDKNLPAQVGERLQSRLAEIPKLESEKASIQGRVDGLTKELVSVNQQVQVLKHLNGKEQEIAAKELEVNEGLRNQEIDILKVRLEESEKRVKEMHGLVMTVFKSPVYRKSYMNDLYSTYNAQGQYETTGGTPNSVIEEED